MSVIERIQKCCNKYYPELCKNCPFMTPATGKNCYYFECYFLHCAQPSKWDEKHIIEILDKEDKEESNV